MPTRSSLDARRSVASATRRSAAVIVALLALGVAGCASNPETPPVAAPQTTVDCRTEGSWMLPDALPTPDPSIPVPGRVPDDFEASAALRCDWVEFGTVEESGGPVAEIRRFEGDLTPLLAALAEPDDPVPTDVVCTADMELVAPLWLESVDGSLIAVHYPRDACGKTKPAVHEALDALEVTSVSEWTPPPSR